jgi:hypothetical protein
MDDSVADELLHAFVTGEQIDQAQEYYNRLLAENPASVVQMLLHVVDHSREHRSLALVLLGRLFSSHGHLLSEIQDSSFHADILPHVTSHLNSRELTSAERRHLAFLMSRVSVVYSAPSGLSDFLFQLANSPDPEIAASGLDCLGLCIENKSLSAPAASAMFHLLEPHFHSPHVATIAPSLRLLYAILQHSSVWDECHRLLEYLIPVLHCRLSSPVLRSEILPNLCTFLENSLRACGLLAPLLLQPLMDLARDPSLEDAVRTCVLFALELLVCRQPEDFMADH